MTNFKDIDKRYTKIITEEIVIGVSLLKDCKEKDCKVQRQLTEFDVH